MRVDHEGGEVVVRVRDNGVGLAPETLGLDIGLPKMDGFEVARRLRTGPDGSKLVLVAVTGYGQPSDRDRCRQAGFNHHMTKPVSLERLDALVAKTSAGANGPSVT